MGPAITNYDLIKMKWRDRAITFGAFAGEMRAAYARPVCGPASKRSIFSTVNVWPQGQLVDGVARATHRQASDFQSSQSVFLRAPNHDI